MPHNWSRMTGGSVAALRYHNVYGPGMPRDTPIRGRCGDLYVGAPTRRSAPKCSRTAASGAISSMSVMSQVPRFSPARSKTHGVRAFNVGSGTPRTVGEMAGALADALKGARPVITGTFRLGDVRHITADSSRLRTELSWLPQVDFRQGMIELASI